MTINRSFYLNTSRFLAAVFALTATFVSDGALAETDRHSHKTQQDHRQDDRSMNKLSHHFVGMLPGTFDRKPETTFDFPDYSRLVWNREIDHDFKHEFKHEFKHDNSWSNDHHSIPDLTGYLHHDKHDDYIKEWCNPPIPSPVPEPSTISLMLASIGVLGLMVRRRKQQG